MAIQKAVSANPYRNRGGSILWGTASSSNALTSSFGFTKIAFNGLRGNRMHNGAYSREAVSGVPYNTFCRTSFSSMLVKIFLGVDMFANGNFAAFNTFDVGLRSSIHRIESFRTLRRVTAGWNYATGAFLSGPTSAYDAMESIDNSALIDTASRPTRAVPGKFTYLTGKPTAVRTTYSAKTG